MANTQIRSNIALKNVILTLLSLLLVTLVWIGVMIAFPGRITLLAGAQPTDLGIQSGQLAPCPSTPNCVSSQSLDTEHSVEPFTYSSDPEKAFIDIKTVIHSLDRTKIITETETYLYAEFTSAIMGFVDDVELHLDKDAKMIHVRSASRLGESDLGVNRKRVETIRNKLNAVQSSI